MTEITTLGQETPPDVSIDVVGAAGGRIGGETPLQIRLVDRSPQLDRSMNPVGTRIVTVTSPEGTQNVTLYLEGWVRDPNEPAVYTSNGRNSLDGFWHAPTYTRLPLVGLAVEHREHHEPIEFEDGNTVTFGAPGAEVTSLVAFDRHTDFVSWSQQQLMTNAREMFSGLLTQYVAEGDRSDENYFHNVRVLEEAVATCVQGLAHYKNPDLWPAGQIKQASYYINSLPFATLDDFLQGGQLMSTFTGHSVLIRGQGSDLPGPGPLINFGGVTHEYSNTFANLDSIALARGVQASRDVSNRGLSTFTLEFLKGGYQYVADGSGIKWVIPLLNDGKDHNGRKLTPGDWAVLAVTVTLKATALASSTAKGLMGSRYTPSGPGSAPLAGVGNLDPIADLSSRVAQSTIAEPFKKIVESKLTGALKASVDHMAKPLGVIAPKQVTVTSTVRPLQAAVDPDSVSATATTGLDTRGTGLDDRSDGTQPSGSAGDASGADGLAAEPSYVTIGDDEIELVDDPDYLLEDYDESGGSTERGESLETAAVAESTADQVAADSAGESQAAALSLAASASGWVEPTSDAPLTLTDHQNAVLQEVYLGFQNSGLRVVGIATVEEVDNAGRTTLTVRVGETGRLLPRRGDSDQPATSLLRVQVYPDGQGDGWIGHAHQVDVAKGRVFVSNNSGATAEEVTALQGGRSYEEYMNDPEYVSELRGRTARTRTAAVTQALLPLVGGSDTLMLGREGTEAANTAGTDALTSRTDPSSTPARPRWLPYAIGAAAFSVVAVIGVLVATQGGDTTDPAQGVAEVDSESDELVQEQSQADAAQGDDTENGVAAGAAQSDDLESEGEAGEVDDAVGSGAAEADPDDFVVTEVSAVIAGDGTVVVRMVTSRPVSDDLEIFDTNITFRIDNGEGQSLVGSAGGVFQGAVNEPSVGCFVESCGALPFELMVEGTTYTMTFKVPAGFALEAEKARLTADAYEFRVAADAATAPRIAEGTIVSD